MSSIDPVVWKTYRGRMKVCEIARLIPCEWQALGCGLMRDDD